MEGLEILKIKKESTTSTEFVFLCLAIAFFCLCIWSAINNNLGAVPFGIAAMWSHNIALAKRINSQ